MRFAVLPLGIAILLFATQTIGVGIANAQGQDLSGVYRGKWIANPTARRGEHGGALRVKLVRTSHDSYRGTFSGRFAIVIPYFYRATVTQHGSQLYSTKKLGPLGNYTMSLSNCSPQLNGTWQAGEHSGRIQLRRRR